MKISVSTSQPTKITVYVSDISTDYSDRYIEWVLDGVSVEETTILSGDTNEFYTYSDLLPETTYEFTAILWVYIPGLGWYKDGSVSVVDTTPNKSGEPGGDIDPSSPARNASIQYEVTYDSITTWITGLSASYRNYDWIVYVDILDEDGNWVDGVSSVIDGGRVTTDEFPFSGLDPSTRYEIVYNLEWFDEETEEWILEGPISKTVSTLKETEIAVVSRARTQITVRVEGLDPSYPASGRTIDWYVDGLFYATQTGLSAYIDSSEGYLIRSLSAGQSYYIEAEIFYNGGSKLLEGLWVDTLSSDRPDLFQWEDDGDVAGEKVKGSLFNLTADSWKRLQDNINEVRSYYECDPFPNGSLTTSYTKFTRPSQGDVFTYKHYNQVLMAIAGVYSEKLGISDIYNQNVVHQNDIITADCFNLLRTLVNNL